MSATIDPSRTMEITSTCHLIPFDPGLYSLSLTPGAQGASGAGLPAARVTTPPGVTGLAGQRSTVGISTFRTDGWLGVNDHPVLIRVFEARSPVLITLYWPAASGPGGGPNLQITRMAAEPEPPRAPAPAAGFSSPQPAQQMPAQQMPAQAPMARTQDPEIIAHVEDRGDVGGRIGDWVGMRGGGLAIQGFSLTPRLGLAPQDLEYRALIAPERLSPWLPGGHFCGSRGLNLPLLGFCIRLSGPAATRYDLAIFARFVDGTEVGPIAADRVCAAESFAPLEAFQLLLRPRGF